MREKDNDEFWLIIDWLVDMENEMDSVKRRIENILTDIRHKRSYLTDYILDDRNDVKEDK